MKKIIISGAHGAMGSVVASLAEQREDCVVVAGFDLNTEKPSSFPVFSHPQEFGGEADVIIDFSHPSFLNSLLSYAQQHHIPLVLATTGFSPEQIEQIYKASGTLPLFFTANMSLGVNLLVELARKAASVLGDFDIEIIDKHHNQKVDAPSGTALMIADKIREVRSLPSTYTYDRHNRQDKRKKEEIGIVSVRGGTIVGQHEILFAGTDEILTLTHEALSKKVFAQGALRAAFFLEGKPNGLYSMKDILA